MEWYKYAFITLIINDFLHNVTSISSQQCPLNIGCRCEMTFAYCNTEDRNITYIPRFPRYITNVSFSRKRLTNIGEGILKNLSLINLTYLSLFNDELETISENAFENLTFLDTLNLNYNPKLDAVRLSKSFASLKNPDFKYLSLRGMKWSAFPIDMFDTLVHTKLSWLILKDNRLSMEHCDHFKNLNHLQVLDLSRNLIISFHCNSSNRLENVEMSRNLLIDVPTFGDPKKNISNFIKYLDLSNNRISHLKHKLYGYEHLEELILNGNPIMVLEDNTISRLPKLKIFKFSRIGSNFWKIESYAFNSSSLTRLVFTRTNFRFLPVTFDAENIFRFCPNLLSLDLSANVLDLPTTTLRQMLKPLRNMQSLSLRRCSLARLPTGLFGLLPVLKSLRLSGNNLKGWDKDVFENTSLEFLDLSNNKIAVINKTSFPVPLLNSLNLLELDNNQYSCTCDLMWFRNWIENGRGKNLTLGGWPTEFKCSTPASKSNTLVKSFQPTRKECNPIDIKVVVITCVTVSSIFLGLMSVVLYKCRWHIRYGLYLIRTRNRKKSESMTSLVYRYDAFVIYAEDNREWVHGILIPALEDEGNLSLCVHYRDFDVGKLIIDNIDECMNASKKVIVVLSNSFAKSEWCQLELRMAHGRVIEEGKDVLLLIMLEELSSRYMTSMLKVMITSTTYAIWSTEIAHQDLFWRQLKASIKGQGCSSSVQNLS